MKTQEFLPTVAFHRDNILKRPRVEDLPTLEDADESKLSSLDMLLREMAIFHAELGSVGLSLQVDKNDQYPKKNLFRLQDVEYANWPRFEIMVKSNWLDPNEWQPALHGGFKFCLDVVQDGYNGTREVADWISVGIKHVNVIPFSFASSREHVRALGFFHDPKSSYFHDITMDHTPIVTRNRLGDGSTFKTTAFRKAVEDACKVMQKIRSRKQHLIVHPNPG